MLSLLFFPLNDVTTSRENPPAYEVLAADAKYAGVSWEYQAEFAERQKRLHPDLAPKILSTSPVVAFAKVLARAQVQRGWEIVHVDDQRWRLEAVATTALMKFKDFVVIEVRPRSGGREAEIHMRSKSWKGKSDLGANAERISEFLAGII